MTNKVQIVLRCQCPGNWKERALTLEEAAYEAGVDAQLVQRLIELGLILYQGRINDPMISRGEVMRIQKMARLRRDLNLNWSGAGLVADLLDEMEMVRKELKRLKSWYEGE
ncbi:MAG: chaperone modulator CbpM [Dehalobacterium sp.]